MCVHDEGGAMGIGVGTEIEGISLHGLLLQLEIEPGVAPDVPVLAGGPVEPQRGFVVHSQDWAGEGSIQVGDSYTLTSTLDVLKAMPEGHGPAKRLVGLWYAGRGAGKHEVGLNHKGGFSVTG